MLELLQKLWNEYASMVQNISDITNDNDGSDVNMNRVDEALADTDSMQKLRQELRAAGVNILAKE